MTIQETSKFYDLTFLKYINIWKRFNRNYELKDKLKND